MSELKLIQTIVASFKNDIRTIVEKRLELFSLQATEAISDVLAGLIPKIVGALFLTVALTLLMFALGMFINELYDSQYLGFLIVGIVMLVLALPLMLAKNAPWNTSIRNSIIVQMTSAMDSETKDSTVAESSKTVTRQSPLLDGQSSEQESSTQLTSNQKNVQKSA